MNANQSLIAVVQAKYKEYLEKVNLTDEAKTRTLQLQNELLLIDLIYSSSSKANKIVISDKLKEVEKTLDSRLKGKGWISYFARSNQAINLQEVWKTISTFKNDPRQHLIDHICHLKQNSSNKSVAPGEATQLNS